jgi:hypothetical protein
MTSVNFDELVRLSSEASKSLQAEESQGALRTAAAFLKSGASGGLTSNHIAGAKILLEEVGKLHQTAAIERTKREQIEASRQVAIAQIQASRLLLEQYMTRAFDERKDTLERLFNTLDEAQARDDSDTMQSVLGSIVDVVKSSPFKDLSEFKKSYNDPNFTLEM